MEKWNLKILLLQNVVFNDYDVVEANQLWSNSQVGYIIGEAPRLLLMLQCNVLGEWVMVLPWSSTDLEEMV